MSENIHLIGTEEVAGAGHRMAQAAEAMTREAAPHEEAIRKALGVIFELTAAVDDPKIERALIDLVREVTERLDRMAKKHRAAMQEIDRLEGLTTAIQDEAESWLASVTDRLNTLARERGIEEANSWTLEEVHALIDRHGFTDGSTVPCPDCGDGLATEPVCCANHDCQDGRIDARLAAALEMARRNPNAPTREAEEAYARQKWGKK